MLNRKGHIPSIMAFIVAVVLVIAVLFSHASFKSVVGKDFVDTLNLQAELEFKERYVKSVFERSLNEAVDATEEKGFVGFCEEFKGNIEERSTNDLEFGTFFVNVRNWDCSLSINGEIRVLTLPEFEIEVLQDGSKFIGRYSFSAEILPSGRVQYIYK
ncbi:MAG: hypothetical protein AABW79_01935 [Nanoarchaeota archaeon]